MHEKYCAVSGIGEKRLQCLRVARDRRVTNDVDRVAVRPRRGQHGVELCRDLVAQFLERDASQCRRIGRHHACTAAVGHERERVIAAGTETCKGFGRHEEVKFSTRNMPARRIAASNTTSEPASAPVCEAAALRPLPARPAFTTITGLLRAAARAADMNLRGDSIDSM
jgi:hypothetical protein